MAQGFDFIVKNGLQVSSNLVVGTYTNNVTPVSNGAIISGNVGIGTASPTQRLHVVGNIQISNTATISGIRFPDGTFQNTAFISTTAVRQSFSASLNQTVFTVAGGYTPGQIDVYYNGVKLLNGTEVDVSSGTAVVLTSPAAAGADIDVVAFRALNVLNAVSKSGDTMTGDLAITAGNLIVNTDDLVVNRISGNVGIGTVSPQANLHVMGNIFVANSGAAIGGIRFPDGTFQTTAATSGGAIPPGVNSASNVTVTATNTDASFFPAFVEATTGNLGIRVDTGLTYNPNTEALSITGNVLVQNGGRFGNVSITNTTTSTSTTTGALVVAGGISTLDNIYASGNASLGLAGNTNRLGMVAGNNQTAIYVQSAATPGDFLLFQDSNPVTRFRINSVGNITAGGWNGTTIEAQYGGTGFSSYTTGNLLYAGSTSTLAQLGITGTGVGSGNVLLNNGSIPTWGSITLSNQNSVTGILPLANGGTNSALTAAAGAMAYSTASALALTSPGSLAWDNANGRIGIGTSAPPALLSVFGAATNVPAPTFRGDIVISRNPSAVDAAGGLEFQASAAGSGYGWKLSTVDPGGGVPFVISTRQSSATWSEIARIGATGNFGIGVTSPSQNLDVNGAALFRSNLRILSTTDSTSATTGALVVGGGIGIAGNSYTTGTVIADLSGGERVQVVGQTNNGFGPLVVSATSSGSQGALLSLVGNVNGSGSGIYALNIQHSVTPQAASVSAYYGMLFLPSITNYAGTFNDMFGGFARVDATATGNSTVNNWYGYFSAIPSITAGSLLSITNHHGFYAQDPASATNPPTNIYGFRSQISSGTSKWAAYHGGTANVYVGGNLTINIPQQSVSTGTGSIVTNGGIGAAGNLFVGGSINGANVNVTGSAAPPNGLFLPSANNLAISTGSTERLRIDSLGNVSIGTASVLTPIGTRTTLTLDGPSTQMVFGVGGTSRLNITAASAASILSQGANFNMTFGTANSGSNLIFQTVSVERARIDTNGFLGIGTNVPSQRLDVSGSTLIRSNAAVIGGNAATSTTTGALTVDGGAGITGNLHVGGTIFGVANTAISASNVTVVQTSTDTNFFPVFAEASSGNVAMRVNGTGFLYNPATNTVTLAGNALVQNGGRFGNLSITNTAQSTSTTTGAVINLGGEGIAGNLFVGGSINGANVNVTGSSAPPNGIFLPATNTLGFATTSSERMRITSTGSLGIGVSNPQSTVDILGGVAIGSYAGNVAAASNTLIVSGQVGIGTSNPSVGTTANNLVIWKPQTDSGYWIRMARDATSNVFIGSNSGYMDFAVDTLSSGYRWLYNATGANGLGGIAAMYMRNGRLYVGAGGGSSAVNNVDVYGNQAIGRSYAGVSSAPADGLIVQGRVGIGTASPDSNNTLQVNGNTARMVAQAADDTGVVLIEAQANSYWTGSTFIGTSIQQYGANASGADISGISRRQLGLLSFQNTSNALIFTNGSAPLIFGTLSTERMRITSAGRMGIGTSVPSSNLHVMGNITISNSAGVIGGVVFADGTYQNTAATSTPIPSGVNSASNVAITNTTTDAVFYPTFVEATSGNLGIRVDSFLSYNPSTELLSIVGGIISQNIGRFGNISVTNATASTSSTTGALVVAGGVGIGANLTVGGASRFVGNVTIDGNLFVLGNTTVINTDQLSVEDPLIQIGTGPLGQPLQADDGLDRGIIMHQFRSASGGDTHSYLGRQNSSGRLLFVTNVQPGVTNIANPIIPNSPSFHWGTAQFGNLVLSGNANAVATSQGTGALVIEGSAGASIGGNLYVGGTIFGVANTAINASNIAATLTNTNATFYPVFVEATTGNIGARTDSGFTYNPSTETLTLQALSSAAATALLIDSGTTGDLNIGTGASAKNITIGNLTGATRLLVNAGTGGTTFNTPGTSSVIFRDTSAPTVDTVQIIPGFGIATSGVNALSVTYVGGAAAIESSATRTDITPSGTAGSTWSAYRIVSNGAVAGVTLNAMKVDNITATAGSNNALWIGSGWGNVINLGNSVLIRGDGSYAGSVNNINVVSTTTNATFYPAFFENTSGALAPRVDTTFTYNPSTDALTAGQFIPSSSTAPSNGLYLPAASTLGFSTGSTERMRIASTGNVGIGTATPQGNLHVMGNLWLSNNAAFIGGIRFPDGTFQTTAATGGGGAIPPGVNSASNVTVTATATDATFFPAFVEATTGNIGIRVDTGLTYNPNTDTMALTGNILVQNGARVGNITVTNSTASTSTSTGAIVTSGGVGIAGDVYAGGNISVGLSNNTNRLGMIAGNNQTAIYAQSASSAGDFLLFQDSNPITKFRIDSAGNIATGGWNGSTIGAIYGGTGFGSYATGDILYASSTSSLARLPISGTGLGSGNVLISSGGIPTWGSVTNINVTATSTNATFYPVFVEAVSGNIVARTDAELTYNPATDTMSITGNILVQNGGRFGNIAVTNATASTSTSTGALTIAGGAGISGNVYAGNAFITSNVGVGTSVMVSGYVMTINGGLAATTKSFVIDHPTKPGMKLRYGSLEGPENGVYFRGRLKDSNRIELPEYWSKLVDPDSITVNLTPIGKHRDLYVESVGVAEIVVGQKTGWFSSAGIDAYFVVFAERADVKRLEVEV